MSSARILSILLLSLIFGWLGYGISTTFTESPNQYWFWVGCFIGFLLASFSEYKNDSSS